jgi:hypothetical protein
MGRRISRMDRDSPQNHFANLKAGAQRFQALEAEQFQNPVNPVNPV